MIKKALIFFIAIFAVGASHAQDNISGQTLNAILTTVPFMTIAPDSRSGAMGDVGAATSPDTYSQHWNSAKYAFHKDRMGVGLAYTPWLQALVQHDLNLLYLSGFYKLDQRQTISGSLRYFNLGTIQYTDETGRSLGTGKPNELAVDLGYSMLLGEYLSGGLVLRYIYSDIAGGQGTFNNIEYNKGKSVAADFSLYYQKPVQVSDYDGEMAYGLSITNIGSKMSYSDGGTKEFIPTNMRLGGRLSIDLDEYNSIAIALDFNKLLVPTPPIYEDDVLVAGKDDNVTPLPGIVQSFYDAPGQPKDDGSGDPSVLREELHEIIINGGVEYWYRQQFAVRAGYFHEHQSKGNRKYLTTGIGMKLNVFSLDFSYLVATGQRNSPLDRTMRFSIGFLFE